MAGLKTQANDQNVQTFLNTLADSQKQQDCQDLLKLMQTLTGHPPRMWGDSIIGFGQYHYRYASGREGDWFMTGFSPRKQNISIYVMPELAAHADLLQNFGKHKTGVCCLYIKRLSDIDVNVLSTILEASLQQLAELYEYTSPS